jgi:hypothetical protein
MATQLALSIAEFKNHNPKFAIVLRTPTLRAGSRFRNYKFEIISLCSLPYADCPCEEELKHG